MTFRYWLWCVAIAVGVFLGLLFASATGMASDANYILARGALEAAAHESADGYFSVGKFSISVPPDGVPATILRQHLGKDVEIVIRAVPPRQREGITR